MLQATCVLNVPITSTDASGYMAQQCSPGYYGPLCSLCTTEGPKRYGRTGVVNCQPCRSSVAILLAYVGNGLLVLLFLTYTIHVTLQENEEAAQGLNDPHTVQASELVRVSNTHSAQTINCSAFGPPPLQRLHLMGSLHLVPTIHKSALSFLLLHILMIKGVMPVLVSCIIISVYGSACRY